MAYFGYVGVGGDCFGCVGLGGGVWAILLGGSGWVGPYFGWVGVGGGEWGWVHCLIIPNVRRIIRIKLLIKEVGLFFNMRKVLLKGSWTFGILKLQNRIAKPSCAK